MPKKIAIIGAGSVGSTLAKGWTKAGHSICFGLRNPHESKYHDLVSALGSSASAASNSEAAASADVVVLATPWLGTQEAVEACGDLSGKIVIDATNPLKKDLSGLTVGHETSGGEQVAEWARQAAVYKAFNTTGFNIMENPEIGEKKAVMFFCGNGSDGQTAVVKSLVEDIGFEPVHAGGLETARLLEPYALLWIQSAYKFGLGRDFAFGLLKR
jgi:8-hydroxy-5-deazaflavin:NADPH oxidoreductase